MKPLDALLPRTLLPGLPLVLLAACSSTPAVAPEVPLPFHVALVPTEIHDTSVLTEALADPVYPERPADADEEDMRLDLGSQEVSRVLRDELAHAFVRATLLELPADPTQVTSLPPAERERYWQERAREVGADLLVRTRLSIDPVIDGERNEKFWLNLPLFLLGGPFCYFVGDRTYEVSARLQAEVFDASVGHESLQDFALLAVPLYAEARGQDLRFLDRASGAGDYLLSILVPAGLLAKRTDAVEEELEDRLPHALGRELAAKVVAARGQFEQNLAFGGFQLESGAASVRPETDGRLRVHVPVRELGGAGTLHRYELWAGGARVAGGAFPSGASEGRRVIDDEIPAEDGLEYVTVRLTDARSNTRSYTLRVDEAGR